MSMPTVTKGANGSVLPDLARLKSSKQRLVTKAARVAAVKTNTNARNPRAYPRSPRSLASPIPIAAGQTKLRETNRIEKTAPDTRCTIHESDGNQTYVKRVVPRKPRRSTRLGISLVCISVQVRYAHITSIST